jgi:hypothetical protein
LKGVKIHDQSHRYRFPVRRDLLGSVLYRLDPRNITRMTTWKEFIRSRIEVLAGTDFFTVEVLT